MIAPGWPQNGGASETPVLELSKIAHRFGSRWVLRGCSLRVGPGEAVGLLGGNGAGKTTLLRIVATLLRATRGEGWVLGRDLRREAGDIRGEVGMMGYSPAIYDDLTAAENLRFAMQMRGRKPDRDEIDRVLEEVGLAEHRHMLARGFSSGMRKRVALARVLLHTPKLLLLDEPYAALDDEGVERVNAVVRAVVGRGGAVLAATHDLPRAASVLDRVARIDDGVLHEIGFEEAGLARFPSPSPDWQAAGLTGIPFR